jgi:transmembrane sensor
MMLGVRILFGKKPVETPHEVAARWLLRREAGRMTPVEAARFAEWHAASPENQRAWRGVCGATRIVADGAADPELMALRFEALHARPEPRHRLWVAMAASLIVTVAAAASLIWASRPAGVEPGGDGRGEAASQQASPGNGRYATLVGERSALTLPDGSVVTLDTNSVIRVAYSPGERAVYLERGQALFEVAKHKKAPFQVYAGDRRVTAVGTTFDVRLADSGGKPSVKVALIEGRIRVAALPPAPAADAAPETISMVSGEVLTTSSGMPMSVVAADTDDVASWRTGLLTFDDVRLDAAVTEMNRYTPHPIEIADDRIKGLHISGVFRSGDPAHFAAVVSEAVPVKVEQDPSGSLVLRAR